MQTYEVRTKVDELGGIYPEAVTLGAFDRLKDALAYAEDRVIPGVRGLGCLIVFDAGGRWYNVFTGEWTATYGYATEDR